MIQVVNSRLIFNGTLHMNILFQIFYTAALKQIPELQINVVQLESGTELSVEFQNTTIEHNQELLESAKKFLEVNQ